VCVLTEIPEYLWHRVACNRDKVIVVLCYYSRYLLVMER